MAKLSLQELRELRAKESARLEKRDIHGKDVHVVVGMGTQRKASVIGSISSVKMTDLKVPSRSLENSLIGRMSGVIGVQRSGEPGKDTSSFWIRGISTFGANQSPLILVDGVERSMTNISPEEIESVINGMADVDESLVVQRGGRLVALVRLKDGCHDKIDCLKKEIMDYVNRQVSRFSRISEIEFIKEAFEKTATHKIRRMKYCQAQ